MRMMHYRDKTSVGETLENMYDFRMAKECSEFSDKSARSGDRYYSAVTKWVMSRGRSPELRENASFLARIYSKSLNLLLECLRRLRRTPAVERKIDDAVEFQTLLKKDMELLSKSEANGGSQHGTQSDNTP